MAHRSVLAVVLLTTTTMGVYGMTGETIHVSGPAAAVEITFDGRGRPHVVAQSFEDAHFAHGFIHARDRFFQMDAMRRLAAGELAAIVGPPMLETDRRYRRYRFRHVAEQILETLDDRERVALARYAAGVNAGLQSLEVMPFEYALLNVEPEPWREEDSILVSLTMFDMLHMEQRVERSFHTMREVLPDPLYEFLTPIQSRFDHLLLPPDNPGHGAANDWTPMPIPGSEVIDLRTSPRRTSVAPDLVQTPETIPGSNNWVVSGSRSVGGGAIVANDPHLRHQVPPIWYRATLEWPGGWISGLSLPGAPGIIAGSNRHVAWGVTNAMGDFQDLIIIEVDPDDPSRYRTPDGWESFEKITEEISVRGRGRERLTLRNTRWGIVIDDDFRGRPLVLKWTALQPEMVNFRLIDMSFARNVDDAVDVARNWYGPSQNVVIGDRDGRIAWVVSGYLPRRVGFDGRHPVSWADGTACWGGAVDEAKRPVVIDPPGGILVTANNRTVPADHATAIGGIWTTGERAARAAELLKKNQAFTEEDLLAIQLDTRLAFYDFYRDLVLDAFADHEPADQDVARSLELLEGWNGRADADQPMVGPLSQLRQVLRQAVIGPLVASCRQVDASFSYFHFMDEEPLRRILEERPLHLLSRDFESWNELVRRLWEQIVAWAEHDDSLPGGIETPWGEENRLRMLHPIAQVMPFAAGRLNMPADPQAGHARALRVAMPHFGASARMVVSPGGEARGILHVPAGQSGDPESPHYRDGHEDWLHGQPSPFLPGSAVRRIMLQPSDP